MKFANAGSNFHHLVFGHKVRIDVHAQSRCSGDHHHAVETAHGGTGAIQWDPAVESLEFVERTGIGQCRYKMHHIEVAQSGS